jgi:hypothetical protein
MASSTTDADFIVWGLDQTAYGPIELPALISWVQTGRVTPDSWIFASETNSWQKAAQMPELQMHFHSKPPGKTAVSQPVETLIGVDPRVLRRVKILEGMTDEQLDRFAQFMELEKVPQWATIVKQGDIGDSMYLILEGELRVRISMMGKETILTTLRVGDFFGDISLFDHGPRSADVVANADSLLLKISAAAFDALAKAAPDLATPFLRAVSHTLSTRIRADNQRFGDLVSFIPIAKR